MAGRPSRQTRAKLRAASIPGVSGVSPAAWSRDGTAAVVGVPIRAGGDADVLVSAVERVRTTVEEGLPPGLEAKVTGPAGFSADATKAFEGINSTLLLVTAGLVFVLLVLIYRSPIFWMLPLFTVLLAESVVRGLGTLLADAGVVINGQTGGILLVLVFGAGTDYALLLTARYREELQRVEDRYAAMRVALRQGGPAIVASAGTVIAALLCLSLARVNSTAGLGPVGAMGVADRRRRDADAPACAAPDRRPARVLAVRAARRPGAPAASAGLWGGSAGRSRSTGGPRWIGTTLALGVLALGTLGLDDDLTTANAFRGSVESVQGQRLLSQAFPAGESAPTVVLVTDPAKVAPRRGGRAPERGRDARRPAGARSPERAST